MTESQSKPQGHKANPQTNSRTNSRTNLRRRGALGEELAARFLEQHGVRVLERNFRSGRSGEIDLVCEDEGTLVFLEVKLRRKPGSGAPEEAVTAAKQRRICRTADYYRCRYQVAGDAPIRFDVMAIRMEEGGARMHWIRNAFSYCMGGCSHYQ